MTVRHTLFAFSALLAAFAARAAPPTSPQSATFEVSATVARVCTISATPIDLGTYDPVTTTATSTGTGTITVQCTRGTGYSIKLDDGENGSRRMKHATATEYLAYQLFSDTARQVAWNATTFVADTALDRKPVDHTVYASIPATQDVIEGSYKDNVKATIEF